MARGTSEAIAARATASAFRGLARGAGWEGVTRELAWRAVVSGHRNTDALDALTGLAEAHLGPLVDDALWAVEQRAIRSWHEYVELRPGDLAGADAAAALDAGEEAGRLLAAAYARVLETLLALTGARDERRSHDRLRPAVIGRLRGGRPRSEDAARARTTGRPALPASS